MNRNSFIQAGVLSLVVGLSACGGSNGGGTDDPVDDDPTSDIGDDGNGDGGGGGSTDPVTFSIGGSITGNAGDVVLALNGGNETFSGGDFTFTNAVEEGADYSVSFISEASGRDCVINNGSGSASADVSDISLTCEAPPVTVESFSIGGTISGNVGDVVLSLNDVEQSFSGGEFTFADALDDGSAYTVVFVSESSGQDCAIANDSGSISADVTNIAVTCETPVSNADTLSIRFDGINISGTLNSGDFNGDGFRDMVFPIEPNGSDNSVRFLFGDGGGTFTRFEDIDESVVTVSDGTRGDYDGDGIDDYMFNQVVGGTTNSIYLGDAVSKPSLSYTSTTQEGSVLNQSADINGDGFVDVVGVPATSRAFARAYLNIYFGKDDGTFDITTLVDSVNGDVIEPFEISGVQLADVNGDGASDIVVIHIDAEVSIDPATLETTTEDTFVDVLVFTGNGDGTFEVPASAIRISDLIPNLDTLSNEDISVILGLIAFTGDMTSGDFDHDGDIDIAFSSLNGLVKILFGDGAGGFVDGGSVVVGLDLLEQPVQIESADFDMDGNIDLMISIYSARDLMVSFGQGDGTFGGLDGDASGYRLFDLSNPDVLTLEIDLGDLVVDDFNSDGVPDAAIASPAIFDADSSIEVFFSPGS